MNKLLKNRVAIVTGGARGIGKAIAVRFAQEGCNLILVSRTQSELEKTAESISKQYSVQVNICNANIGDVLEIKPLLVQSIKKFGKIDILVNNAAIIGPMGEISSIDGNEFLNTLKNNVGGTIFCTQVALPFLKDSKYGCIINFIRWWRVISPTLLRCL